MSSKNGAKYTIDPCKACHMQSLETGDSNINTLNNCLTETWAAYNQQPNNKELFYLPEESQYRACLNNQINKIGRTSCQLRLNPAAVFVNDPPHFFPKFLSETNDPEKAYSMCVKSCGNSNDCTTACKIDRNAVVELGTRENFTSNPSPSPNNSPSPSPNNPPPFPSIKDIAEDKPVSFWITFIVIALIFAFILTLFFIVLFAKLN